ncbi:hypothetical protein EGY25_03185 [Brevundimonas intermedia]|uniref:Uncharacterized protein n=1 Tax=Brevundimonas intermedia TaxID=74315 RepID=A0A4Y9RYH2_9CAUL|nr:hypothetical protein [Brevundimonas intermedia]TFW14220.1 hypothetical protein EGY25_03185 [Brevundimonas intermedia]
MIEGFECGLRIRDETDLPSATKGMVLLPVDTEILVQSIERAFRRLRIVAFGAALAGMVALAALVIALWGAG